jgi:hypothetical protein
MKYGIIFWGNSSHTVPVFILQKREIGIITRSRPGDPCRELFKKLKILPFQSQYIFSLLLFVVNSKDQCKLHSEILSVSVKTPTFTNHYIT